MPILRHELTLLARRQRLTLWRCVYAVGLAVLGGVMYFGAIQDIGLKRFGKRELAQITEYVFLALFALQFFLGAALAPQWAADAIAGEKERRSLTFLLATPLSSRTIVLGKLASRLAQIGLLLLAGLPVLLALQFFGGVEPGVIWLGTVALAATVVSAAALSVLASVYAINTKAAAQRAGQVVALYVFGMLLVQLALRMWPSVAQFPSITSPVTVADVYDWVNVGNPVVVGNRIADAVGAGAALPDVLAPAVRDYVAFHAVAALLFVGLAVRRLRPVAASQGDGTGPPAVKGKLDQPPPRPPVSDDRPVTWKMMHCDFRLGKTKGSRAISRLVFLLSFAPLALTLGFALAVGGPGGVPIAMNGMVRGVGTLGLCVALMHIVGQASASVGRERQKQTLDELLLTDLSTTEILGQKWLGAFLSVRWIGLWAAIHWAIGVATGGLHPLAVAPLALAFVTYAASAASLGIYWAARSPSLKQAGAWAGLSGFGVGLGPLVVLIVVAIAYRGGSPPTAALASVTMSPPAALGMMALSWQEWGKIWRGQPETMALAVGVVLGLVLHAALAWGLWRAACRRFPQMVGRE